MSDHLVTVEQAAEQLKLHRKTVLRYIHEGRLAATRIGKSYRIERARLEAFAGVAMDPPMTASDARATCIVDIPRITQNDASRITTFLTSAAMTGDGRAPPLHVSTAFDPQRESLKAVVIGSLSDTARLLEMLQLLLDGRR